MPGEHGDRAARAGFNALLASLCQSAGALLIMDEVLTGFRVTRPAGTGSTAWQET